MNMENWKPVVGYEGWYDVSDQGRVRRASTGRIRRLAKDKDGYNRVVLHKENISCTCKVHRLVLTAFNGLPLEGQECNHKNGIKTDNYPENLEWLTHRNNMLHSRRVLGRCVGELQGQAKLKNQDIPVIKRLLVEGRLTQRKIAEMFGVCQATIKDIKFGRHWAHIS